MGLSYRPEIDGLRALAVLVVVFFHAGWSWFEGGYVGVDIFFVISGYLITSIIWHEKQAGVFTIRKFYERRARRILPALFFIILLCLPFAWLWMTPLQLKDLAQSMVAVVLFSSNILFWKKSGYFAEGVEEKPLLHTWSLAVEEQYYLVFPLLILVLWQWGRRRVMAKLAILALLSFALSEWGWRHNAIANFYLAPMRAWELFVGSLVALANIEKPLHERVSKNWNQVLSLIGLGAIAWAVLLYDRHTPFPSAYALLPVLGTALIVAFATAQTWVGQGLSRPFVVGIGLISYSVYLWHQPLFAFARIRSLTVPPPQVFAFLIALTFLFGFLTWRYIEHPFRDRRRFSQAQIFKWAVVASATVLVLGVMGHIQKGFEGRVDPSVLSVLSYTNSRNPQQAECNANSEHYIPPAQACRLGAEDVETSVALWGDSHADALASALGEALKARHQRAAFLSYTGCPPVPGVFRVDADSRHLCPRYSADVMAYLQAHPEIKTVVLAGRWTLYLEKNHYDNGEGGIESGEALYVAPVGDARALTNEGWRRQEVARLYQETVRELLNMGKKVIWIYPIPEVGWSVPTYLAKLKMLGYPHQGDLTTSYPQFQKRNTAAYEALNAVKEHPQLVRVFPEKILCNTGVKDRCLAQLNGTPLYFDDDHLSTEGARLIVQEFQDQL